MVIKREVVYGIVEGLKMFWKSSDFQDFTVKCGTITFGCHRIILAACSEFFSGLFRSGMKETERKSVKLTDVSSETFELILESIYTGHGVLTNENVIDIWRAADQLQIHFLVSECEQFILNTFSKENYEEYFYTSYTLNSAVVLDTLWPFVLKNWESFLKTSSFLQLSFSDVLRLIQSQDLETHSEDNVIHAILKWVEFHNDKRQRQFSAATCDSISDSDRRDHKQKHESRTSDKQFLKKNYSKDDEKKGTSAEGNTFDNSVATGSRDNQLGVKESSCNHLLILLSHSRLCLASQRCLQSLVTHSLVSDNKEARDIVIDALMYKLQVGKRNGQWPSRAVHRNNSDFIHCLVDAQKIEDGVVIKAYSLSTQTCIPLPGLVNVETMKLAAVDNKLYALCTKITDSGLSCFEFEKGYWSRVNLSLTLKSKYFHCAVVDSFVYIFFANEKSIWKLDVTSKYLEKMEDSPNGECISYTVPYDQCILVFYNSTNAGVEETLVQRYDYTSKTWRKLNNLEGPANGMTSFKDDNSTYLLQSNGNMWKVVTPQSDTVDFELVAKLWSCNWTLYGAVTFMHELYIHGESSMDINENLNLRRSLPGFFCKIHYLVCNFAGNSHSIPIPLESLFFDD